MDASEDIAISEIDTYEMANLSSRTTGLPLTVWVSPRGKARHDARIKVCLTPGKMVSDKAAVVAIRPEPRLIAGDLASSDFDQIARWIVLNQSPLIDFWNEQIDSAELGARLRKLDEAS